MAPSATATEHNPAFLSALVDRFDPDAIDLPGRSARIRLAVDGADAWDALLSRSGAQLAAADGSAPDALLRADGATWRRISGDVRGGMEAFRRGRLSVRQSLHLGVGFLAATSGSSAPERLRFDSVRTRAGRLSILAAGSGEEVLCLHGLGGTKASFLPTVAALADRYRVIALDLPGFGESAKPFGAPYDARYLARAVVALLDELELESAHLIGNSMGGRVAIEVGLLEPARVRRLVLLCPALAWLRDRRWRWPLRLLRPELGVLQPTPRRLVEPAVRRLVGGGADTWTAAGVDEFLRSYLSPRGRAAFYAAARNIYLDEPRGERGLWTRLAGLSPETMFVWGRRDPLVPIAFMRHVEETLPAARHLELDCGHVPQLEAPRETHAAIASFLGGA